MKQMFKMMSLRTDAGPECLPPFTNGRIDDCLLHIRPHLDQTLFQLIYVMYGLLVHVFLKTAPTLIIDQVTVRAVRRSGAMNSGVAWRRYSNVAHA